MICCANQIIQSTSTTHTPVPLQPVLLLLGKDNCLSSCIPILILDQAHCHIKIDHCHKIAHYCHIKIDHCHIKIQDQIQIDHCRKIIKIQDPNIWKYWITSGTNPVIIVENPVKPVFDQLGIVRQKIKKDQGKKKKLVKSNM